MNPEAGQAVFLIGDVFERMAELPDGSVDLVLTSPPFLALRSYLPADHPDKAKEIGSEPTPAEFLDTLLALTAEWGRLVGDGSIAVELGDTYSGSGGAGGDYNPDGLRDGQERFDGSARRQRAADAWPLAKSLCMIPQLYAASLAYGRNLLTGEESPAGQWRVRNIVRWVRPNPPVGALGDKYRPATSEMVVATKCDKRWFDLDAVRGPVSPNTHARTAKGVERRQNTGKAADDERRGGNYSTLDVEHMSDGAPPLDWWEIPTAPYKGAHYAAWPPALCERPIKSMCPPGGVVLDPFAGSGTTLAVATGLGRAAIGIDLDDRNVDLARERVGMFLHVEEAA